MSCQITDTRLYIKAVDKAVTRELKAHGAYFGDSSHTIVKMKQVCPAVTIANSETGQGRLSVRGGLYSDFCSNLASFGERSMKKTHIGKRHELCEDDALFAVVDRRDEEKNGRSHLDAGPRHHQDHLRPR